jgi:predicted dehydrogenase
MTTHARQAPQAPSRRKVRYAVVGLGHIAQVAVLPAFANARENSVLAALVSGDAVKREELGRRYGVSRACGYDEYEDCLRSGDVDAVYIALPNSMHREYAERAADAGVHVLCEKPMAVTEEECEAMMRAAERNGVRLMIAYRLHFERANLEAIEIARSGRIGEPRLFDAAFTMRVADGNIRLEKQLGGGTLYDIGIYCINAARNLFRAEPVEVQAACAGRRGDVEETASCLLRFPEERMAAFTCSFGAGKVSAYQIVGTRGDLRLDPAFEYAGTLRHRLTVGEDVEERSFEKRDQFAPQLVYFSECVLNGRDPEPSGDEGLADVRVIRALYESARVGRPVRPARVERERRPGIDQEIHRPAVDKPEVVHAEAPSGTK